jgi:hypothetical protein
MVKTRFTELISVAHLIAQRGAQSVGHAQSCLPAQIHVLERGDTESRLYLTGQVQSLIQCAI